MEKHLGLDPGSHMLHSKANDTRADSTETISNRRRCRAIDTEQRSGPCNLRELSMRRLSRPAVPLPSQPTSLNNPNTLAWRDRDLEQQTSTNAADPHLTLTQSCPAKFTIAILFFMSLMFVLTDANAATYPIMIDRFKLHLAGRHHHHKRHSRMSH